MKNWQETEQLFMRLQAVWAAGGRAAMGVITAIQGSTYRRPGAKLLIEEDGALRGNISGGCLEEDVREAALQALAGGKPRTLHYDTSDTEDKVWGMGLGCNGQVDIWLVPFSSDQHAAVLPAVCERLQGDTSFLLHWLANGDLCLDPVGASSTLIFTEDLEPPPTLLICGAGEDALPLARLAHTAGFRVVVADHRSAYLTAQRFPQARQRILIRPEDHVPGELLTDRTLAVVKTHSAQHDAAWVRRLAATAVPYIGVLGPRERRDEIRNTIDPAAHPRIYGPVGLDIGGEGPEQVALSIVAEALACWHNRQGGPLRNRKIAIHAQPREGDIHDG